MARKKLVPKKIGSVRIPKNLRRMGDKALADPKIAGIVAGAVAAAASLVAAGRIAEEVPGGASLTRSVGAAHIVHGITDLIKRTLEEVVQARDRAEDEPTAEGKKRLKKNDVASSPLNGSEPPDAKVRH